MRHERQRVANLIALWILIFAVHATASTRQRQPFARSGRPNSNSINETIQSSTVDPLNEETKNHTFVDAGEWRRRPFSNWFAPSINRETRGEEEDHKEQELNDSNSTESNTTSTLEWSKGRYWPTSSQRQTMSADVSPSEKESKETDAGTEGTKEAHEPPNSPIKDLDSETESPTFQPPFSNLFRDLRGRLTPGRAEIEREADSTDKHAGPENTTDLHEESIQVTRTMNETKVVGDNTIVTGSQIESDTTTLLTRMKDSAETVTIFLRQLPWQRQHHQPKGLQEEKSIKISEKATAESSSNATENATIVAQDGRSEGQDSTYENSSSLRHNETQSLDDETSNIEEKSSYSGVIPIFARMKESAGNATSFARRRMQARREARRDASKHDNATRIVSSNPITIIRNLPWTPEEGKKYMGNVVPSSPTKVNPIQFIRGLPWTRRRSGDMSESSTSSTDEEQKESTSSYNDTYPDELKVVGERGENLCDTSSWSDDSINIDDDNEAAVHSSGSTEFSSSDSASISQESGKRDEELALEVEDMLSKYLVRQEDEMGPNHTNDRQSASGEKKSQVAAQHKSAITFSKDEKYDESGRAINTEEIAVEETSDHNTGVSSVRLESLFNRVLGSMETQQEPIKNKSTLGENKTDDTSLSNVTATNEAECESLLEPDGDVTIPNKTQPVTHGDKESPKQPRDQQRDQLYDQRPQPHQQQPTVVIMGGGPQDGRSLPADLARRPVPTPSLVLVEALVTIFGTAFRIWLISFLAKWWSEEETLKPVQHFVWERLNDRYLRDATVLQNVLQLPPTGVTEWKWRRFLSRQHRVEGKVGKKITLAAPTFARTVIVLNIGSDLNIPQLEQAVTFILSQHREQAFGSIGGMAKELEVVLLVDSPGGAVSDYGLAGSQIRRLRSEVGVTTTVCIDKIAASGGYMIASQADRIFASSFAVVGSIGVIREGFNIHDALERYGIKGFALKAGDSKVPLTMLGPVTKGDLMKAQRTLDLMHRAFKDFVVQGRPLLEGDIEDVANGDIHFGEEAMQLSLIDRIVTSEEYLLERVQAGDRVMKLHRAHQFAGRRRQLFHPLDLLREKGTLAWNKWLPSDTRRILSRAIAATSAMGAFQFLTNQNFLFGGS